MRVVWDYISSIHRSRSEIWTQKMGVVTFLNNNLVTCCDEGVVACLDKNIKDGFDAYFYLYPLRIAY